jgi:hypothetical protein
MPIVGDLLFKAMDMPYADEISERLKKMMPPQLQEQPEGGESQEVIAVKEQASQIIQQLQEQIQAAQAAMAEAEQEAQVLVARADNAEAKAEIDAIKAQNDARKIELDHYKAQTDRLALNISDVDSLDDEPMMQEFLQQNAALMETLLANVNQSIEQNQMLIESMANKSKTIEITSPSGQVYTGVVQ